MNQHCPTCRCGEPAKETKYRLNSGHVSALMKFAKAVHILGRNSIHIRREMYSVTPDCPFKLGADEWTNFSYLRIFGLVVHADPEKPRSGYWTLTKRGGEFLRGEAAIWNLRYAEGP